MSIAGTTTTTGALDTPDSGTTVYGAQGGWLHKFDVLYNSSLGGGDGNDLVLQRSADTTAYPYEWGIDASGAWSAADAALENWRHYVQPDGADAHVLFGSAVTAPQTVTLDAPKTAGHLVFDNANAYLLDGAAANALTLATTAGDATVTVSSGAHTIAAPVALANDLSVDIANAADSLTMTGDLSGAAGGLTKTGPGTLTLDGDNTYPGRLRSAGGASA